MSDTRADAYWSRSNPTLRYSILGLSCFFMFGNYFVYDNPSPLQTDLEKEIGISTFQYNLLYSVYSIPNTVLPFLGGIMVDRFGVRSSTIIFCVLVLIGQCFFALGAQLQIYEIMLLGRVIFGMGGESLCVAQSAFVAKWFRGRELAMAMGLNLSIARLGSVANDNAEPRFSDHFGYVAPGLWIGAGICVLSLISALVASSLDKRTDKEIEMSRTKSLYEENAAALEDLDTRPLKEQLRQVRHFSRKYWLITASCVATYIAVMPFMNNAANFLTDRYHYSKVKSGTVEGIPYIISAAISPILGHFVDRFGYRPQFITTSSIILASVHFAFAFTRITPYVPLVFLGLGYSVYAAALWPSIVLVVDERNVGIGMGFSTAVQNAGLALAPLIIGAIKDATNTYTWSEVFIACCVCVGVVAGFALIREDARTGYMLSKPEAAAAASREELTGVEDRVRYGYSVVDDDEGAGSQFATEAAPLLSTAGRDSDSDDERDI